jgi:hypothetical protein
MPKLGRTPPVPDCSPAGKECGQTIGRGGPVLMPSRSLGFYSFAHWAGVVRFIALEEEVRPALRPKDDIQR